MNVEHNLILIKNQDKTEQIDSCKYINHKWLIRFYNSNKVFTYNESNVVWLRNPNLIDHSASIVYVNNQPISGINFIQDFGKYIRLFFNSGYKKTYLSIDLTIEQTCLTNQKAYNCFDYLKTLANQVSVKFEEDMSFLSKQYNNLTTISPRSVLAAYLERKPLSKEYNCKCDYK